MRPIDADALKEWVENVTESEWGWQEMLDKIDAEPTIDAVPAVRCKDCKNMYEDVGGTVCVYGAFVDCITPNDFYCAFGERRNDETG